ncbi:hypothetical protein FQA39_LY17001 [Lamprigera yunnana]|nr:hypothetical protein FQA39_LY17001 [Lamprigera yunnana]
MLWLLLLGGMAILYYYWGSAFQYWKKKNVPHPKPSIFFGNIGAFLTMKKAMGQVYEDIYTAFPEYSYVGFYRIRKPALIIRDPHLIRNILGKDFNSFHDNDLTVDETVDPIGAKNPFMLKGEKWKIVKNQITPCFTGKKLKSMYGLIEDSANKLVKYISNSAEASSSDGLEANELCAKYSTEVVANCVFGLEGNTFEDPDSMFRKMGKKTFEPTLKNLLFIYMIIFLPSLTKILRIGIFSKEVSEYFLGIVKATIKYRKENNVVRNDFFDFLLELKNKDDQFTEIDITAQAVAFFTDGFETSSAVLSFVLYDLATNPKILQKVHDEVNNAILQRGTFDYDSINELKYMEAVINESLRLHPPGSILVRVCTQPFKLPSPKNGVKDEVEVEVGTPVVIPVQGLHYDSQYFKDPLVYDPERFLPENKERIVKGSFLPFGEGARSCHGQRFALLQIKVAIVSILRNFDIKLSDKTKLPLEVDPAAVVIRAKGGLWIRYFKRQ